MPEQEPPRAESAPQPDRPVVPESYGIPTEMPEGGTLPWSWAREQLAGARNYWVATTRPDGRPHVMPVWGLWLDEAFYFSTGRSSRKERNLAARPEVVVHLESGDDVVILEGAVREVTDAALLARFADAYEAKYQFRPEPGENLQGFYRLRPRVAYAWRERDFPTTATRWLFPDARSLSRILVGSGGRSRRWRPGPTAPATAVRPACPPPVPPPSHPPPAGARRAAAPGPRPRPIRCRPDAPE